MSWNPKCILSAILVGAHTTIYPFVALGHAPQVLNVDDATDSRNFLHIGEKCSIREGAVLHPGSPEGSGLTHVGDNCLIMSGVHIGHDARVGDDVVKSANTSIGGHVHVGNGTVIGGQAAVHQRVHIGHEAMIGGHCGIDKYVPPWALV